MWYSGDNLSNLGHCSCKLRLTLVLYSDFNQECISAYVALVYGNIDRCGSYFGDIYKRDSEAVGCRREGQTTSRRLV